jgi:uncharacterized protein YneF (UPF0154 family)
MVIVIRILAMVIGNVIGFAIGMYLAKKIWG